MVAGALIGMERLHDNSFLTHLATGRLILDSGSVPGHDPYSYTAVGEPWVVQSWAASAIYATAESIGGLAAVRLIHGLVAGAVAAIAWLLLRPISRLLPRLAAAALFLTVAAELWSERPFMFGLLAFGAVMLAAEGRLDPRWLLPVGWLWTNTHGSFPLGLVYLVVGAVGRRLDGDDLDDERRSFLFLGAGILAGAIGPVGHELLTFPISLLARQDVLSNVVEWQAPSFQSLSQRAFILQLVLTLVLMVRRPSFRGALLVAAFTAAALVGARNLGIASLVMLPVIARSMPELGSIRARVRTGTPLAWAPVVLLGTVLVAARMDGPHLDLRAYPLDALAFVESQGWDTREVRMAAPEMTGNLLTLVYGPEERVFYDDRFDMYPAQLSADQLTMTRGEPGVWRALDRYDVGIVVWPHERPLTQLLAADPRWRTVYTDEQWTVSCRRAHHLAGC